MTVEIITKEDLNEFREKLLHDILALIGQPKEDSKKWLKSYQVKNMLKISPNTLHKLRAEGVLNSTKIGGILYYRYDDIVEVLNGKKKN